MDDGIGHHPKPLILVRKIDSRIFRSGIREWPRARAEARARARVELWTEQGGGWEQVQR